MVPQILLILFIIGMLFSWPGCSDRHPAQSAPAATAQNSITAAVCPGFEEVRAQHIFGVLLDRSGSVLDKYKGLALQTRNDLKNLIHFLPTETFIFGRYIAGDSYSDSERIFDDVIPAVPGQTDCATTNPFDIAQKLKCRKVKFHYETRLKCVDTARARIEDSFESLAPERSRYTDIWGAITAVEEIFAAYRMQLRELIIYSDLDDNVRKKLPEHMGGFQGVRVIVRSFRIDDRQKADRLLNNFTQVLGKWGAEVSRLPMEKSWRDVFNPVAKF